jgi:hypothetical protein
MKVGIYTRKDINDAYNAGLKTGIRQSIDSVLDVITIILQDHYGATPEELQQLQNDVNGYFQSVIDGDVTLKEISETVKEEIKNNGPSGQN